MAGFYVCGHYRSLATSTSNLWRNSMKNKLFFILVILMLGSTGLSAKADVLIDTSNCQVIFVSTMMGGGYINALVCPDEADYWITYFVRWMYGYECAPHPTTPYYRVEGTCENYVVYRVE